MKRNVSASSAGTSNETTTASSVSRLTARTRSGWKCSPPAAHSRLEVLERLAAGAAAVQRLARRRAERRQPLGVGAAAARAGEARAADEADGARADAAAPGGAMPCACSFARPSALIQSVVHAGARCSVTVTRAEAGVGERGAHVAAMTSVAGQPRVGRRQHDLERVGARRRTSRTMPRSHTDSAGTSRVAARRVLDAQCRRQAAAARGVHHRPPGMAALQSLHLGQDEAEVLAVHAERAGAAEGACRPARARPASSSTGATSALPVVAQLGPARAEAGRPRRASSTASALEHLRPCSGHDARRAPRAARAAIRSVPSPSRTTQSAACCWW